MYMLKKLLLQMKGVKWDAAILPLVSFMQVVRKAGSEEKLKAVFHSRSLHCFCFIIFFLGSKAKQSMHFHQKKKQSMHSFIERIE